VVCASGDGIVVVPRAYAGAVIDRLTAAKRANVSQPSGAGAAQDLALDGYFEELKRRDLLVSIESPSA
jgi:hypothetical protein